MAEPWISIMRELPSTGAVIVIVLAFLKFLKDERECNAREREAQRTTFTGQCAMAQQKVVSGMERLEGVIDRSTGVMEQLRGVLLKVEQKA